MSGLATRLRARVRSPLVRARVQGAIPTRAPSIPKRTFSVAMTTTVSAMLSNHLTRADGNEDLTFALYQPSTGLARDTALLVDVILPEDGERHVHGNASFTGAYFLRAAGEASERDLGLAFLHAHPGATTWQGMSTDDYNAEQGHASQTQALTGLPLIGLTLATGNTTFSARRWVRRTPGAVLLKPQWAHNVRVVGDRMKVSFNPKLSPAPASTRKLLRTVQAWGQPAQDDLARLRVGIIGAGSVGQLVAESLARTGIQNIEVFDFDDVAEHNLDRLVHATADDIGSSKTTTLIRALTRNAVAPDANMTGTENSVVEEEGWLRALDCDVLFSCVDRPWPRYALNVAAYTHLIPVIDGGVAVDVLAPTTGSDHVRLVGAEWRAHMVAPGRRCMECLGQYDPADVSLEQSGLLDDPTYINGLPTDHHLRRGENVFAFSMACAAAEVLELLRAVLAPSNIADVGATLTHWATATTDRDDNDCKPTCYLTHHLIGTGDAVPLTVTGPHPAAEQARANRRAVASAATTRPTVRTRLSHVVSRPSRTVPD